MKYSLKLSTIIAKDIDESVAFYRDVLGFEMVEKFYGDDGGLILMQSPDGAAVELGNTFGELKPFSDYTVAFTELQAGAIDAIAIDAPVAKQKIDTYGDEYYCLEESYASEKYGICFRKADTELCKQVEDAYMQLVEDGTYIALGEKYGLDTSYLVLAAQ